MAWCMLVSLQTLAAAKRAGVDQAQFAPKRRALCKAAKLWSLLPAAASLRHVTMVVPRAACLAAVICAAVYAFDTLPGQELTTEEAMRLVGDRKAWRAIFSDNYPELVADGFEWPEGPTWLEEEKALIFSDTITGKPHQYKDGFITLLKEHAGGCEVDVNGGCDSQQLEPGSNGMARIGGRIAVCQHGARRLAFLDLASMNEELIVDKHGRARLNGPNDIVATPDALYFTDPYYALLEKGRPADAQYADDKSELGFAGVYRYDLGTRDLELLDSSLARPNGIGIVNGSHLRPATPHGGRVDGVRG